MWKIILLVIAVALVAFLLFVATRPDTCRFSRSILIQAPPASVFPLINDMKAFNTWNPYEKKDPNIKGTYSGPESGPGAAYSFQGNKDVGSGRIAITGSTPNAEVLMNLTMTAPFAVSNNITFTINPEAGGSRVTWTMEGPVPYLAKIAHLVFDMDKMIGTDFDNGLKSLKALAEKKS